MQKLIQDRFAEDLNAAQARAERCRKKEQTKEMEGERRIFGKGWRKHPAAPGCDGGPLWAGQINGNQLEKRRYPLRAET